MSITLFEQLPEIVAAGKRQAEQILEGLESRTRIGLQTRDLVVPAKDSSTGSLFRTGTETPATLGGNLALRLGHPRRY